MLPARSFIPAASQGTNQQILKLVAQSVGKSACFQVRTILAKNTRRSQSVFLYTGRLICRRKMMSCCRNSAFSASRSALLLVTSANVPSTREVDGGFIHRNNHC